MALDSTLPTHATPCFTTAWTLDSTLPTHATSCFTTAWDASTLSEMAWGTAPQEGVISLGFYVQKSALPLNARIQQNYCSRVQYGL